MSHLSESELIVNPDGSIYHLNLRPEELAHKVITVGDPQRVSMVSQFFDRIEVERSNREIVTHTGVYKGERITVISTGMGVGSIDIVLNELDALVNVDLQRREIKETHQSLEIIRIGTCGGLQESLSFDQFVASRYAIDLAGLLHFYDDIEGMGEISDAFHQHQKINSQDVPATVTSGSIDLLQKVNSFVTQGITLTCAGFYAPQGRRLRLKPKVDNLIDQAASFCFDQYQVTNFEMETAAIFGLGQLLGHQCGAVNVLGANRVTGLFNGKYQQHLLELIELTLDALAK